VYPALTLGNCRRSRLEDGFEHDGFKPLKGCGTAFHFHSQNSAFPGRQQKFSQFCGVKA
jgi:hypothetical protein